MSVYVVLLGKAVLSVFFFNDTATTEIYTLSLHDALPISLPRLPTTSSRKLALPMSTADDESTTARIASAWVRQQVPTQCPPPPWMLTTAGSPVSRAAASTARPGG